MAKILVVDDRPADRKYLTALMTYARHQTIEAGDGLTALDAANQHEPDLVITDVLMPGIDGYEFARRLRATPRLASTPVIFYTATYHEEEARALAGRLGVAHVLIKPSEPAPILALIEEVLARSAPSAGMQPIDGEPFHRDHLRVVSDKLVQKVQDLENVDARLATLLGLAQQFASERDPRVLLERMCDAARLMVGADVAGVGVLAGDERIDSLVTRGLSPQADEDLRRAQLVDETVRRVVRDRQTINGENPTGEPAQLGLPASHPPIHAFLLVPLASPSQVHGWFIVARSWPGERFTPADEDIARTLGAQAGVAYENARLIDELRQSAERLRAADERTEYALTAARCGVWQADLATGQVTFTRSLTELLGIDSGQLLSDRDSLYRNIPDEDADRLRRAIAAAQAHCTDFSVEFRHQRPGGQVRWFHAIGRAIGDAAGEATRVVGVTLDITERRSLEAQLRQAQKMEAVGQLAGGVAHDFNNLLTAILGYSRFLLDRLESPDQRRDVEEIVKASDRAASLTKQLLAFSRRQVVETRLLDLNSVVADMADMVRRLIGEHIELRTAFATEPWLVRADRGHLDQVVMNLVVNASDAMPRGGTLTLETQNVELDESFSGPQFNVRPGKYAMLAVTDTGTGMTEETKARLFEPFYTTKAQGRGTGLGLATVYGIVSQSGGHIRVYSELNRGTTFKVYLPRAEDERGRTAEARPMRARVRGGTETLLVVEDEDGVRTLVEMVLSRAGYTVIMAADPAAARDQFARVGGAVDLLISDVVMPGGTGPELFEALAAQKPELRVLFMSGYTDSTTFDLASLEKESGFIQKPFTTDQLTRAVRQVLDR